MNRKRIGFLVTSLLAAIVVGAIACGTETKTVEVVREVQVEKVVTIEKPVEVIKEVVVEKIVERPVEKVVTQIVEVPVEVIKEVPVERVVTEVVEVVTEVVREVPVEKIVTVEKRVVVVATAAPLPPGVVPSTWGGTLRLAAHGPPSQWDVLAGGSISNLGSQASMYNKLVRHSAVTADLPIVPDLAYGWEVSSDGKGYTFYLREGVKFHDGSNFDAEDVKASFERIAFPPEGFRSATGLRGEVTEINIIDPFTVEFRSTGASPLIPVFANGWMVVVTKEALEETGGNLATVDNTPGTGPFKYVSRNDEKWVQERFVDYWNPSRPHADRLEQIWLTAWSTQATAALLSGIVDWAQWLPSTVGNDIRDGKKPGIKGVRWTLALADQLAMNSGREIFADKRVRKAFGLAIDEQAIRDAVADIRDGGVGDWFIVDTAFSLSEGALLATPGIRVPTDEDIALAKSLLAEAGYPDGQGFPVVDYMTRDVADERIVSAAVQAMIKKNLNIEMKIRITDASVWGDEIDAGSYDFTSGFGLSGITTDPAGYMKSGLSCLNGVINSLYWCNDEFDKLVAKLGTETDMRLRLDITSQMRTILMDEWPSIPIGPRPQFWGWTEHLGGDMPPADFAASYVLYTWDDVWLGLPERRSKTR